MKTTGWISTGRRVELSDQLLWSLKVALTWRLTYLEVVIWNMKRAMRRVFASASNLVVTWFWDVLPWFDMICRQPMLLRGSFMIFLSLVWFCAIHPTKRLPLRPMPAMLRAWGLNLDDLDPLGHASWTEPLSEAAKEEVEEMPRKLQTAGGICWNNHHVGTDAESHSRDFDILVLVKCWVFFGCFLCASGQICTGSLGLLVKDISICSRHFIGLVISFYTSQLAINQCDFWSWRWWCNINHISCPPCTLVKTASKVGALPERRWIAGKLGSWLLWWRVSWGDALDDFGSLC